MIRTLGLVLLAAVGISTAAMAETVPSPDRYTSAYSEAMRNVGDRWVGNAAQTVLSQPPGATLTSDYELRIAVQTALGGLQDPRFKLLSAEEADRLERMRLAGEVNLGAKLESVDLVGDQGIKVTSVDQGSYAYAADVSKEDKILMVNGRSVNGMRNSDLDAIMKSRDSGNLKLVILRSNALMTFDVPRKKDGSTGINYSVINAVSLPKVSTVDAGSPAADVGLRIGDQIDAVDGISTKAVPLAALSYYIQSGGPILSWYTLNITRAGTPMQLKLQRRIVEGSIEVMQFAKQEADSAATASDPRFAVFAVTVKSLDFNSPFVMAKFDANLAAASHLPGAVLDLRGVGGNQPDAVAQILARFTRKGVVLRVVEGFGSRMVDQVYSVEEGKLTRTTTGARQGQEVLASELHIYDGKLAVVVDKKTSGAALAIAQSLQASGRARVIGERTSDNMAITSLVTTRVSDDSSLVVQVPSAVFRRIDDTKMVAVVPDFQADLYKPPLEAFETMDPLPHTGLYWWQYLGLAAIFGALTFVTIWFFRRRMSRNR